MSDTYEGRALAAKGEGAELIRGLVEREAKRIVDETAEEEWATDHGRKHLLGVWNAYLDVHGTSGPLRAPLQAFIRGVSDIRRDQQYGWAVLFQSGAPIHRDSGYGNIRLAREASEVKMFRSPSKALQFMMQYAVRLGKDHPNRVNTEFYYRLVGYEAALSYYKGGENEGS